MAADEMIDWDLGKAPKQSITELLHNPRGPTLELPDVSTFDLSTTSLSLTPVPQTTLPKPLNINHFESYLRRYGPLHNAYVKEKNRPVPSPEPLETVPSLYFDESFSLSSNDQLSPIQSSEDPLLENTHLPKLNKQIAKYRITLEHHLKLRLDHQASEISNAIFNIRALRETVLDTARSIREAREDAAKLVPTVTTPIAATERLTLIQSNLRVLTDAAQRIRLISNTPSDITVLLETAEYSAAIDAVASAKEALKHEDLSAIKALTPLKARLVQCVESIDKALRQEFRDALSDGNEVILKHIVTLVARMDRLSLLLRFFMRENKENLSRQLEGIVTIPTAVQAVRESAQRAVMLIELIQSTQDAQSQSEKDEKDMLRREAFREAHAGIEEMLCTVVDRIMGSLSVDGTGSGFIIVLKTEYLTPETCFNEFKAALRFGEELRILEEIGIELEERFQVDKRGGALRAKISERQIAFVGAFHKAHVEALTEIVHGDKWQEVRVPDGALRLLDSVTNAQPKRPDYHQNGVPINAESVEGMIVIGSDAFKTGATGVRYMRSMCAYTLLAEKASNLASEIARRANELCRLFNSLVGKAILGAAALQWSGLRSITARHLSLASRTIGMAVSLANQVNQPLESALSGSQATVIRELIQKSERDLRDHHGQLLAKILAIMMDRLEAHETVLRSLPWDKAQEMQRFDIPSAYIVTLAKEATVLHRILWSILPKIEVFDIFQRVCAAYGDHLTDAYGSLDGGKKWIRKRVAHDVGCLHEKLLVLDVFKANPSSFKPLSRLYTRFAKEALEEQAGDQNRSFNRQLVRPSILTSNGQPLDGQKVVSVSEGTGGSARNPLPETRKENEASNDNSENAGERPMVSDGLNTGTAADVQVKPDTQVKPGAQVESEAQAKSDAHVKPDRCGEDSANEEDPQLQSSIENEGVASSNGLKVNVVSAGTDSSAHDDKKPGGEKKDIPYDWGNHMNREETVSSEARDVPHKVSEEESDFENNMEREGTKSNEASEVIFIASNEEQDRKSEGIGDRDAVQGDNLVGLGNDATQEP